MTASFVRVVVPGGESAGELVQLEIVGPAEVAALNEAVVAEVAGTAIVV